MTKYCPPVVVVVSLSLPLSLSLSLSLNGGMRCAQHSRMDSQIAGVHIKEEQRAARGVKRAVSSSPACTVTLEDLIAATSAKRGSFILPSEVHTRLRDQNARDFSPASPAPHSFPGRLRRSRGTFSPPRPARGTEAPLQRQTPATLPTATWAPPEPASLSLHSTLS